MAGTCPPSLGSGRTCTASQAEREAAVAELILVAEGEGGRPDHPVGGRGGVDAAAPQTVRHDNVVLLQLSINVRSKH